MTAIGPPQEDHLYTRIVGILEDARTRVSRTVNTAMVSSYWLIGREIVQVEQAGKERAAYGEQLMRRLAERLTTRFGRGYPKSLSSCLNLKSFLESFQFARQCRANLSHMPGSPSLQHLAERITCL